MKKQSKLIDSIHRQLHDEPSDVIAWVEKHTGQISVEIEQAENLRFIYEQFVVVHQKFPKAGERLLALLYFSRGKNRNGQHEMIDSIGLLLSTNMSSDTCNFMNRIYNARSNDLNDMERAWWIDHCSGWGCRIG